MFLKLQCATSNEESKIGQQELSELKKINQTLSKTNQELTEQIKTLEAKNLQLIEAAKKADNTDREPKYPAKKQSFKSLLLNRLPEWKQILISLYICISSVCTFLVVAMLVIDMIYDL
jgi:FtsZ-binding cell division protein ZapB